MLNQPSHHSFEVASPTVQNEESNRNRKIRRLVVALSLVAIVALIATANFGHISSQVERNAKVGANPQRQIAKQCLMRLHRKIFMEDRMGRDSRTLSFLIKSANLASSDAKIFFGKRVVPLASASDWSTPIVSRMDTLHRRLLDKHKQYAHPTLGVALVYNHHDIVTIDPDECVLTGVYLGDAQQGVFHPAVEDQMLGAKPDDVVACLSCGESHSGNRPVAGTTDEILVYTYTPLSRLKISTCNSGTNFFTSLKLFDQSSGVKVSGSSTCGSFSFGKKMTISNIKTTSSSPVALNKWYEIRVGDRKSSVTAGTSYKVTVSCTCANIRRDWSDLGSSEQQVYTDGFKELRSNGKLAVFTNTHIDGSNSYQAHSSSAFLPWHRYYLWELERQIRSLGGRYSCFSLSYWDWTRYNSDPASDPLWSSVIGGDGTSSSDECVASGELTRSEGYYTPNRCATSDGDTSADVSASTCCLKRDFSSGTLATSQTAVNYVLGSNSFTTFRPDLEGSGMHNSAHCFIRGHMCTYYAPDDPVFFLLHGFVDFMWALWQDCYEYDKVASSAITSSIYSGVSSSRSDGVDDTLLYNVMTSESWAYVSSNTLTPRDMHSIQDGILSYTYDQSDLISRSSLDASACTFDWISVLGDSSTVKVAKDVQNVGPLTQICDNDMRQRLVSLKQQHPNWTRRQLNAELARLSCIEARELAVKNGKMPECKFDSNYEKCGQSGSSPLQITLGQLLAKRGVAGNDCLMRIRRKFYEWAEEMGELRGLCNGEFDPKC